MVNISIVVLFMQELNDCFGCSAFVGSESLGSIGIRRRMVFRRHTIRLVKHKVSEGLLCDWLVFRYKNLHECPSDEVGDSTIAKNYHVASRFTCDTKELEGFTLCFGMSEKQTAAPVDGEGTETAKHGADTCDRGDG